MTNWSVFTAVVSSLGLVATVLGWAFTHGKLTQKVETHETRIDKHEQRLNDHSERIGRLEGRVGMDQ